MQSPQVELAAEQEFERVQVAARFGHVAAPRVQAVCARYGVPYHTGSFGRQLWTVLKRIARYSLPGGPQRAVHIALKPIAAE